MQKKLQQLLAFKGQPIEREDSSNLDQCFDEAFAWCEILGIPHSAIRHTFAYQIYRNPTDETHQYFDLIPASQGPNPGDLAVWDPNTAVTGSAGHVDTVVAVHSKTSFQGFDQNWGGKLYGQLIEHTTAGVAGFLRPKMDTNNSTNNKGEDMPTLATQADVQKIGKLSQNMGPDNPAIQDYVGKPLEEVLNFFWSHPNTAAYQKRVNDALANKLQLTDADVLDYLKNKLGE